MPKPGEVNYVSGIYRSECCGVERAVPEFHKFPPCAAGKYACKGANATWTLVRRTQTR